MTSSTFPCVRHIPSSVERTIIVMSSDEETHKAAKKRARKEAKTESKMAKREERLQKREASGAVQAQGAEAPPKKRQRQDDDASTSQGRARPPKKRSKAVKGRDGENVGGTTAGWAVDRGTGEQRKHGKEVHTELATAAEQRGRAGLAPAMMGIPAKERGWNRILHPEKDSRHDLPSDLNSHTARLSTLNTANIQVPKAWRDYRQAQLEKQSLAQKKKSVSGSDSDGSSSSSDDDASDQDSSDSQRAARPASKVKNKFAKLAKLSSFLPESKRAGVSSSQARPKKAKPRKSLLAKMRS